MLRVALVFCVVLLNFCSAESIEISTKQGKVKGTTKFADYGIPGASAKISVFRRIPFAQAPLGERRFKRPQTVVPEPEKVINEGEENVVCTQSSHWFLDVVPTARVGVQSEDCLYLSVYTPEHTGPGRKFPVLVYIHGGSYQIGGNIYYDGSVLASLNTVVVIINYRLGPFGFMGDGSDDFPGNNGIYDQIEALKWIQKYISDYGGDPSMVTIMGHSAGGWSVGVHILSPMSKDLFRAAIIQSGPVLSKVTSQTKESLKFTFDAVKNVMGCEGMGKECLTEAGTSDLSDIAGFVSSVPWIGGELLPDKPEKLIEKGELNKVPVLMGTTADECARFITLMNGTVPDHWLNPDVPVNPAMDVHKAVNQGIITGMEMEDVTAYKQTLVNLIRHSYTDFNAEIDSQRNRDLFLDLLTDYITVAPTVRLASALSKAGLPVYLYSFTEKLEVNAPGVEHYSWLSGFSYHEVDIPFSFGAPLSGELMREVWFVGDYNERHKQISKGQMAMIILMVHSMKPVAPPQEPIWPPYKDQDKYYVLLTKGGPVRRQNPKPKRMQFWNEIYNDLVAYEGTSTQVSAPEARQIGVVEYWVVYVCVGVIGVLISVILILIVCTAKKGRTEDAA